MSYITPIHPGLVLQDELDEIGVSQSDLAKHIGVLPRTINEICKATGNSAKLKKMNLQKLKKSPPEVK